MPILHLPPDRSQLLKMLLFLKIFYFQPSLNEAKPQKAERKQGWEFTRLLQPDPRQRQHVRRLEKRQRERSFVSGRDKAAEPGCRLQQRAGGSRRWDAHFRSVFTPPTLQTLLTQRLGTTCSAGCANQTRLPASAAARLQGLVVLRSLVSQGTRDGKCC